jgi:hypothetical protein
MFSKLSDAPIEVRVATRGRFFDSVQVAIKIAGVPMLLDIDCINQRDACSMSAGPSLRNIQIRDAVIEAISKQVTKKLLDFEVARFLLPKELNLT